MNRAGAVSRVLAGRAAAASRRGGPASFRLPPVDSESCRRRLWHRPIPQGRTESRSRLRRGSRKQSVEQVAPHRDRLRSVRVRGVQERLCARYRLLRERNAPGIQRRQRRRSASVKPSPPNPPMVSLGRASQIPCDGSGETDHRAPHSTTRTCGRFDDAVCACDQSAVGSSAYS